MAGYGVDEPTVLDKFIKGLPNPLAKTCVEMDTPDTWEEWKASARRCQDVYLCWRQILGVADNKKDQSSSKKKDLNKWCQGFNSKCTGRDPNTMDMTPGHTRACHMTTDERTCLMNEGKCFNCQCKGHFSRDCPQSPSPPNRNRTHEPTRARQKRKSQKTNVVSVRPRVYRPPQKSRHPKGSSQAKNSSSWSKMWKTMSRTTSSKTSS